MKESLQQFAFCGTRLWAKHQYVFSVAQIGNLLYRRMAFCGTSTNASALELSDALPIPNRRYGAARRSLVEPQPKERGVYAASAHEGPQLVKCECSLEILNVEAA